MKANTTGRKGGAGAPIEDASGEWSAGLRHDGQAGLVGTILAAMPHLDELMADLVADRLGEDARPVLAALDQDDAARIALLEGLARSDAAAAAIIDDYAAARRLWRAYGSGLWYTHLSGRTYLAAPDAGGAAFRVAREVKPTSLRRALTQVDRLAAALAALVDAPAKPKSQGEPKSSTRPPKAGSAARPPATPRTAPEPAVPATPATPPAGEAARTKRAAPVRTTGARRRPAPVRPSREKAPPEAGTGVDDLPTAAE